jgi:hypothetical protein
MEVRDATRRYAALLAVTARYGVLRLVAQSALLPVQVLWLPRWDLPK